LDMKLVLRSGRAPVMWLNAFAFRFPGCRSEQDGKECSASPCP
jgi:hypothetical protein